MLETTSIAGAGGLLPAPAGTTRTRRVTRSQAGAVTAETAVVLPVMVALALGLAWLMSVGVAHVRAVDAARETARATARGETPAEAIRLGRMVAPEGAHIEVSDGGGLVTVQVRAEVVGPGGLFEFLPPLHVDASAVTAKEPS